MLWSCALIITVLLCLPSSLPASESCEMLGGTCRDRCELAEQAETGSFEDCGETEECCVAARTTGPVRCCVRSFSAKDFGPSNCLEPGNTACLTGSASPLPCAQLPMCR
jgi:hypothetical protein